MEVTAIAVIIVVIVCVVVIISGLGICMLQYSVFKLCTLNSVTSINAVGFCWILPRVWSCLLSEAGVYRPSFMARRMCL